MKRRLALATALVISTLAVRDPGDEMRLATSVGRLLVEREKAGGKK
jgi:hypothetical protein